MNDKDRMWLNNVKKDHVTTSVELFVELLDKSRHVIFLSLKRSVSTARENVPILLIARSPDAAYAFYVEW